MSRVFKLTRHFDTIKGWIKGLSGDLVEKFTSHLSVKMLNVSINLFIVLLCNLKFVTCVCDVFVNSMEKRKISFGKKSDLRIALVTRVAENVEKEPLRGMLTSPFECEVAF